jgi:hypothetical protein
MSATLKRLTIERILAAAGAPTVVASGITAPTSGAVTSQGTTGATTYTYVLVSKSAAGSRSLKTANITTTNGNATLSPTNKSAITWTDDADNVGGTVEVYRTAGGATQGFIGAVAHGVQAFDDTGIAAVGTTVVPVATSRKYKIVTLGSTLQDGSRRRRAVASSETTQAASPEALSEDTPMHITWSAVTGAQGYEVWRTDSLLTGGLIGTVAAGVTAFDDVGEVGDGATAPTADETGISDEIDVLTLTDVAFQVGGTFVASIQPQGTINGSDWIDEGSAITSGGYTGVTKTYAKMRMKQTAYTSGTPTFALAGR